MHSFIQKVLLKVQVNHSKKKKKNSGAVEEDRIMSYDDF